MDKNQIFTWLLEDAEKYADKHYESHDDNIDIEEDLYQINMRKEIELPPSLPKNMDEMIPVLRTHFKDNINFISIILNHYFPEEFIFYRASKLEEEILRGLEFLGYDFPYSKLGSKNFNGYLELNKILLNLAHEQWPDLKNPQKRISFFLYQGLGNLFLEKSDYNRYWIMATKPEYSEVLNSNKNVIWSGRKEMQQGDLVFMYRTAPRKAITDIFRVRNDPDFDPWWPWGFWVELDRFSNIKEINITISDMRDDPILGQWSVIKRQFQGVMTEPVPHSIYNKLLEKLPEDIKKKFDLRPEPVAEVGYSGQYASEQEFEDEFIVPLLKKWGFQYQYQYPQTFHVGSQEHRCRVDFYVSDEKGHLTLFEDKLRIIDDIDLKVAVEQAKSYALMLGLSSFVVASPEGMWIYKLNKNQEELVKNFNSNDIQSHDAEIRSLFLDLR